MPKRLQELEGFWLPVGENPAKYDMKGYIRSMLNESGKQAAIAGCGNLFWGPWTQERIP